ncbi:barstar family protein [Streptomyces himalayensis]|uniref:Barstar family protein n=1 Tax=Streptomyces himalayensis subsp. himalayensis TaxID=2756131 RepID=A0A7W0DJG6_9ACTN|nr:barstar family protein [Streptomyces himalayensis]MBA2946223.1 barstar family protein [Streptomyces himalayensis subsp. himalayensis]
MTGHGWATVLLDLTGAEEKAEFMERCARALELPEWFGRNWDALADSLTDVSVWPSSAAERPDRGLLVVVTGWQGYAAAQPGEWDVAQEVFAEAVDRMRERGPALSVMLALGGSDQPFTDMTG